MSFFDSVKKASQQAKALKAKAAAARAQAEAYKNKGSQMYNSAHAMGENLAAARKNAVGKIQELAGKIRMGHAGSLAMAEAIFEKARSTGASGPLSAARMLQVALERGFGARKEFLPSVGCDGAGENCEVGAAPANAAKNTAQAVKTKQLLAKLRALRAKYGMKTRA